MTDLSLPSDLHNELVELAAVAIAAEESADFSSTVFGHSAAALFVYGAQAQAVLAAILPRLVSFLSRQVAAGERERIAGEIRKERANYNAGHATLEPLDPYANAYTLGLLKGEQIARLSRPVVSEDGQR